MPYQPTNKLNKYEEDGYCWRVSGILLNGLAKTILPYYLWLFAAETKIIDIELFW